jgi:hypothetical protein
MGLFLPKFDKKIFQKGSAILHELKLQQNSTQNFFFIFFQSSANVDGLNEK